MKYTELAIYEVMDAASNISDALQEVSDALQNNLAPDDFFVDSNNKFKKKKYMQLCKYLGDINRTISLADELAIELQQDGANELMKQRNPKKVKGWGTPPTMPYMP